MRAISLIAAAWIAISGTAVADPPSLRPPLPGSAPGAVALPPGPPELAPLAPDFQAAMANSQLQTFRYNQLTEQAVALKKLCETGFGPADICPKPGRDGGVTAGNGTDVRLPVIDGISGAAGALTASVRLSDGRRLQIRPGSLLPGGISVAVVSDEDVVVVLPDGSRKVLPFGGEGARR